MNNKHLTKLLLLVIFLALGACTSQQQYATSSIVEFLYPDQNNVIVEPQIPVLTLPLNIGLAFVPNVQSGSRGHDLWGVSASRGNPLIESHRLQLLERVAEHFKEYDFVRDVEIIPSAYLRPGGSFTNLDQIRTMYGVDVIALVSYDQVQFTDQNKKSLTYWTIVGAYLIAGETNDTHTMLDTAVYDIQSRRMLFRAPGINNTQGETTAINLAENLRRDSVKSFDLATDDMIQNLDAELQRFKTRIKENPERVQISKSSDYSSSGGLSGAVELLLLLFLALGRVWQTESRRIQPRKN